MLTFSTTRLFAPPRLLPLPLPPQALHTLREGDSALAAAAAVPGGEISAAQLMNALSSAGREALEHFMSQPNVSLEGGGGGLRSGARGSRARPARRHGRRVPPLPLW